MVSSEPKYREIRIEGKLFYYKNKGEEIFNNIGKIPNKIIFNRVKRYITDKKFRELIDKKYKKKQLKNNQ